VTYTKSYPYNSEGITMEVNSLRGTERGIVGVLSCKHGSKSHTTVVNLSDVKSIQSFIAVASRQFRISELSLESIVFDFVREVLERFYALPNIEPLEMLDNPQHSFLIEDFILENNFNLLFARGGTGKSFIALLVAVLVQNADKFKDAILKPTKKKNVLYLDWEADKQTISARYTKIVRGMFMESLEPPLYMQLSRPLFEHVTELTKLIEENDIGLVIIDSVGLACGGSIEDQSTALAFFQASRELITRGCTVLALTHMSKSALEGELKTPIGSIYFENMPRLTWQILSNVEGNTTRLRVVLRKSNVGKLDNFGLNITFDDYANRIFLEPADNSDLDDEEELLTREVIEYLQENSGVTPKQISEELGYSASEVKEVLKKLKKSGKVEYKERRYFLKVELPPF